ncbi:MAG: class I SAM-dependent methyltransferase [Candidatus Lindowbacteria bacterium]|nr:class I SAM-dependent methyltransferase [Candidatus Lindowbacteria bacterium]
MSAYRNCSLCGSGKSQTLYKGLKDRFYGTPGAFDIAGCGNCGLSFLDPVPPNLSDYYPTRYYSYQPGSAALQFVRRVASAGLFYLPKASAGQSVLDIGCGNGEYLERMRKRGWMVYGIEKDERLVTFLRQRGIPAFESIDEALGAKPHHFDLVSFNSALEHMEGFRSALEQVRRLLKKGGEIVILVPNVDSREHRVFGGKWFHLDPPRHLWHFSPSTAPSRIPDSRISVLKTSRVRRDSPGAYFIRSVFNSTRCFSIY